MSTETKETKVERVSPFQNANTFTQEQALRVLIEIAKLAQSKGILSMDDAVYAAKAIEIFTAPPVTQETKEEVKNES